jgi:hypothetical protein
MITSHFSTETVAKEIMVLNATHLLHEQLIAFAVDSTCQSITKPHRARDHRIPRFFIRNHQRQRLSSKRAVHERIGKTEEETNELIFSKRTTLSFFCAFFAIDSQQMLQAEASYASTANGTIVEALKQKKNADEVEFSQVLKVRLGETLDEFRKAKTLSDIGSYANARKILRDGPASSLRKDLVKVADYVKLRRPTFAEFEAAEVVAYLEAWDNAMRAMEVKEADRRGDQRNVTANDVQFDAKSAINALEEIVYLVSADATYVDAHKPGGKSFYAETDE